MQVAVVGGGYVGLVTAACLADSGNSVIVLEADPRKLALLQQGECPIVEPALPELMQANIRAGRISFTSDPRKAVKNTPVALVCVGTPSLPDGRADLTNVRAAARSIAENATGHIVITIKSTVPVGTCTRLARELEGIRSHPVEVASNPEFLKEGSAVNDFTRPDRVVIGVSSEHAKELLKALYGPFVATGAPILVMDECSAEMSKYASNCLLASRISFMNELANLCSKLGADIEQVRIAVGADKRIGQAFLFPGIGYGGSCFPKDVRALIRMGDEVGVEMGVARSADAANVRQRTVLLNMMAEHFGGDSALAEKTIAVWGLAFKARTDDVRESPALFLIEALTERGVSVRAFDPAAGSRAKEALKDRNVEILDDEYEVLRGADALVIATEWNEFRQPDLDRIKELMPSPVIFDGRNMLAPSLLRGSGIRYYSIGRPAM